MDNVGCFHWDRELSVKLTRIIYLVLKLRMSGTVNTLLISLLSETSRQVQEPARPRISMDNVGSFHWNRE
jgi:hypothetical protein